MNNTIYRVYYPVSEGGGMVYEDFTDEAAAEDFRSNFRESDTWVYVVTDEGDVPSVRREEYNPTITQLQCIRVLYQARHASQKVINITFPYYEKKRAKGGIVPFVNVCTAQGSHLFGAFVKVRPDTANDAEKFVYDFMDAYLIGDTIDHARDIVLDIEYEFK